MTCNAECTVFRDDGGIYVSVWQGECMWQDVHGIEVKKYGADKADKAVIFLPDIDADIRENDIIIKGRCYFGDDAARNGLTVMSVAKNDFGSPDMRHIEVGRDNGSPD